MADETEQVRQGLRRGIEETRRVAEIALEAADQAEEALNDFEENGSAAAAAAGSSAAAAGSAAAAAAAAAAASDGDD